MVNVSVVISVYKVVNDLCKALQLCFCCVAGVFLCCFSPVCRCAYVVHCRWWMQWPVWSPWWSETLLGSCCRHVPDVSVFTHLLLSHQQHYSRAINQLTVHLNLIWFCWVNEWTNYLHYIPRLKH